MEDPRQVSGIELAAGVRPAAKSQFAEFDMDYSQMGGGCFFKPDGVASLLHGGIMRGWKL